MNPLFDVRLYPITDRQISGLCHEEQVRRLIEGGATVIQLREKILSPLEFYSEAQAALRLARQRNVQIIINDRVDIALALKADGVHLGQNDLPPAAARQLLGSKAIIGFSTHNPEQARHAMSFPIDYIAVGPIFNTSTKNAEARPLGIDGLRQIRDAVGRTRLVAIGGIKYENSAQTLAAGADSVAVISAILAVPERITEQTKKFLNLISTAS
jgi:thiamine-phosphate pyrophosphorylase